MTVNNVKVKKQSMVHMTSDCVSPFNHYICTRGGAGLPRLSLPESWAFPEQNRHDVHCARLMCLFILEISERK